MKTVNWMPIIKRLAPGVSRSCFGLCLVLGGGVRRVNAQDEVRIREIVVTNVGPGQVDASMVLTHTGVAEEDVLDRSRISAGVRRLIDTEHFADISVFAEESGDGARLTIAVRNRWKLASRIRIEGAENFRTSKLREWFGIEPGMLFDENTLGAAARRVEAEYREDYYPDTRVTWDIDVVDASRALADVRVKIAEGKRARVCRLAFDGNHALSSRLLRGVVRPRTWYNPFSWFRRVAYDAGTLEDLRRTVRLRYLADGFLDVEVESPAIERDASDRITLHFTIREGTAYRFGDIDVGGTGVKVFPAEDLARRIAARRGDVASDEALRGGGNAVRDYFGERGYIQTSVRPVLDKHRDEGIVDVSYVVREGQLVSIRNIMIHGNTRTRDKVIRRELLVYPGEIFNEVKVRRSERILMNLGFFDTVRSDPVDTRLPDEKDLAFMVAEKRTGQFMIGAGFSSEDQALGFMEVSQGNFDLFGWPYFTGGGQKLKLRAQVGQRRSEYQISFVEPWFLNRKLSLGIDLYRSELDYTDYDLTKVGAALSLSKALPGPNRIRFRYKIEEREVNDVADTNAYVYADNPSETYTFADQGRRIKSTFGIQLTHDTRNSPFVATRGNKVTLSGDLSGGVFGFDTDIYELAATAVHYQPLWWRHVLSVRTRWEVVDSYGDTDEVPLSDRLFIGGGRTVRGYDFRDVGPKVVRPYGSGGPIHRPVGGQSLALGSVEYAIPIVSALRLAAFYDIGNVWRDPYEFELTEFASSAGVGLRFDLPGFPIRIDRAWPLERDSDLTDTDEWTFWIGFD